MKEYTVIAVIFIFVAIFVDNILHVHILRQKKYYLFLFIILLFKIFINGYLTGYPIVIYNENVFWGVRLMTIPLEDFLFGFSMVTMTIIFWEYFKQRAH